MRAWLEGALEGSLPDLRNGRPNPASSEDGDWVLEEREEEEEKEDENE